MKNNSAAMVIEQPEQAAQTPGTIQCTLDFDKPENKKNSEIEVGRQLTEAEHNRFPRGRFQ